MYYKNNNSSLIKCEICGKMKADYPNMDFFPIVKSGVKLWLCHNCKISEDIMNKSEESEKSSITMIFMPKE